MLLECIQATAGAAAVVATCVLASDLATIIMPFACHKRFSRMSAFSRPNYNGILRNVGGA